MSLRRSSGNMPYDYELRELKKAVQQVQSKAKNPKIIKLVRIKSEAMRDINQAVKSMISDLDGSQTVTGSK